MWKPRWSHVADGMGAIVAYAGRRGLEGAAAARFENFPGHGAAAHVDGRRVTVGNRRLMEAADVGLGDLAARRDELAVTGRTAVIVARSTTTRTPSPWGIT